MVKMILIEVSGTAGEEKELFLASQVVITMMVMMIMMVMMMTMTRSELWLLGRGGWEPSTGGTSRQAAGTFSLM